VRHVSEEEDPREPDPNGWDVVRQLRFVQHALEASLDATLRDHGISLAQLEVMVVLDDHPNHHAAAIARILGVRRQTVHDLLRQLHRAHHVGLLPKQEGLRGAYLTPAGRRVADDAFASIQPILEGLIRRSPSNGRDLVAALRRAQTAFRAPARSWWLN
jgi:DNA-binding MarR family transcriptional regulator